MRWLLALLAAAGTGLACGSFGSADDAATPSPSTSADAASSDGASLGDAALGTDGGAGADASCDEVFFERFTTLTDPPWKTEWADGGVVQLDPDGGVVGSGALRAAVNGATSTNEARISRQLAVSSPTSVTLKFAMQIQAFSSSYYELGCTLQVRTADGLAYVLLRPELSGLALRIDDHSSATDGSGGAVGPVATLNPGSPSEWYRVELTFQDFDLANGTARSIARVDGFERLNRPLNLQRVPESVRVKCGIDHADDGASGAVLVDDVVLQVCR